MRGRWTFEDVMSRTPLSLSLSLSLTSNDLKRDEALTPRRSFDCLLCKGGHKQVGLKWAGWSGQASLEKNGRVSSAAASAAAAMINKYR